MAAVLPPIELIRGESLWTGAIPTIPSIYEARSLSTQTPEGWNNNLNPIQENDAQVDPAKYWQQALTRKQAVRRARSPRIDTSEQIHKEVKPESSSSSTLPSSSCISPSRHSSATSRNDNIYECVLSPKENMASVHIRHDKSIDSDDIRPSSKPDTLIDSDNSSASTDAASPSKLHARCNSTNAEASTINHVEDGVSSNTNEQRPKGKEVLFSIRNISWAVVEKQDVRNFCLAYDKPSGSPDLDMGAVLGIPSRWKSHRKRPLSGVPAMEYTARIDSATSTSPEQPNVLPSRALECPLQQLTREGEQLLILKRQQRLERLAAQTILNEQRMQERLESLRAEALTYQKRAEELRSEVQRREEADLATALALQRSLDEEDIEACRLAELQARLVECTVCGDEKDKDNFSEQSPTATCQHASQVCADCMDRWIVSALADHGIDGIKCPECPEKMAYANIQAVASPATFEAYDKATAMQALSSLPEFAWCLAPDCKSGQLNIENSNFMDCASCRYKQCLQHKVAWHAGETCAKYEYRTSGAQAKEDEEKTLAMLDTMSKICPGPNCGWRIQKTEGCDHVTCRKCQFQFCWQCLASHVEIKRVGNTAHKKECKFHSDNLDIAWPFNRH